MFEQFGDFSHEDTKGLFTFYREQAQNEEELRKLKKQRKLAKKRQSQLRKRKEEEQEKFIQQKQPKQIKQGQNKEESEKILEKDRKSLYEPKTRRQKYNHQQLGTSVIIVNAKESQRRFQQSNRPLEQKNSLKKIEELINPHNNNRYFLQNKQIPASFGKMSLEKMVVKGEGEEKESKDKKNVVRPSYFNRYNDGLEEKKYIPAFSYDKLPELVRSRPAHSEIILPKRYKSKKIELALKSNNSELIRQIREGLKGESLMERISYVDANQGIYSERASDQLDYERRLNSQLDAKQRRLIEIIRNSSKGRNSKCLS